MKKGAEVREIEIAKKEETRKDKEFKKWQSLIDKYSRFGKFKFRIKRGRNIEEDYHIMIMFDRDKFLNTNITENSNFNMNLNVFLIKTDETLLNYDKTNNIYESDYLENAWEIKINIGTNKYASYIKDVNIYNSDDLVEIVDRRTAYNFKKLLISLFTSKEYPDHTDLYGSLYESINNSIIETEISSDFGFSLDDVVKFINGISLNKLYQN
jgi:hypothetical protein